MIEKYNKMVYNKNKYNYGGVATMKNNTKKVLACLIAGTVAVGIKYKLDQAENKKKKKTGKKTDPLQKKGENKNRYIKIKNTTDKISLKEDMKQQEDNKELENSKPETKHESEKIQFVVPQEMNMEQMAATEKMVEEHETITETEEIELIAPVTDTEQSPNIIVQENDEITYMENKNTDVEKIEEADKREKLSKTENTSKVEIMPETEDVSEAEIKEETVDLEEAKRILKRKINWQEADGVKTEIDYSRLPAAAVLNVSGLSLAEIKSLFTIEEISEEIFKRIYGKSYKADCIVSKEQLRYLRMLYYGFDDKTHVGEMIVNVSIAEDIKDIFYLLYQEKYQIERMVLVDEYQADDVLSMAANNTSSFNYRKIDGMSVMSKHSRGMAVDVNPKQNPYVRIINGEVNCQPQSGEIYMDREKDFPHKIDHEDLCYCLFRTYGFTWGGDWEDMKDYQHFQKQSSLIS